MNIRKRWRNTSVFLTLQYNIFMEKKDTITISKSEYEALCAMKEDYTELQTKCDWLMEQMRLAKHQKFSFSSEKQETLFMDQMSLVFNEAEGFADFSMPEIPEEVTVTAHKRKKHGTVKDILPTDVPVEVVEHTLPKERLVCPQCGSTMTEIGKEEKETLVIIPAQVKIRRDVYYTYACQQCKQEDVSVPVAKAPKEPCLISKSFASPEAVAYLMYQKYVMGSPIYRIERDFLRNDIQLSRQTMSNWMLRCSKDWLEPIYNKLHTHLLKEPILHADETTLQVLKEPGKRAQTKSYMWLYRTGKYAKHPVVLYEYQPNRKAEHPEKFLKGFTGYLHVDGYAGYHRLDQQGITVVGCLLHARRKFTDALRALPKQEQHGSSAEEGLAYFTQLFSEEKKLEDLTTEERYIQRLEKEKPILDALLAWSHTQKVPPKSALGKAIHYFQEQWPYLINFLEDGNLELTNNLAERSIKPFVIDRKNFLFANTPNGAQGSAVIFSIIETAKENGLDPYKYLVYIFQNAPKLAAEKDDWATSFLPENVPIYCKASKTN